jgi:hypothetical protein
VRSNLAYCLLASAEPGEPPYEGLEMAGALSRATPRPCQAPPAPSGAGGVGPRGAYTPPRGRDGPGEVSPPHPLGGLHHHRAEAA